MVWNIKFIKYRENKLIVTTHVQNVRLWLKHKLASVLAIGQLYHQSATAPGCTTQLRDVRSSTSFVHISWQFLPRCMECRRGLVMRIVSVSPSVRPSVKRVNCDKTKEKSVKIFTPYERSFSLVFWEKECLVGATPSTWNFGSTGSHWSDIADFEPIFARSA